VTPAPHDLYAEALRRPDRLRAHCDDGTVLALPVERWLRTPDAIEHALLARARPPVLDVGCGPGRHVLALAERGIPALGIDSSAAAVAIARRRGAAVLRASVFKGVPLPRCWRTALLLDGSIGIGGDAVALLARVALLLRADGEALVEVEGRGTPSRLVTARLELAGRRSRPFAWARVGWDGVEELGQAAGFALAERWSAGGRCFVRLRREDAAALAAT
jgi:SAM-dependent methyltransferase